MTSTVARGHPVDGGPRWLRRRRPAQGGPDLARWWQRTAGAHLEDGAPMGAIMRLVHRIVDALARRKVRRDETGR
ncbi:hypothetical protein GIS00_21570 [Nakamurella sp. YIM 132087]|uniref:Uncharacterized protein n=1 Tax=Nakamurella alba TaxID=2665158 RepID=A0A7K1FR30_9ACTN|nr:hypothetical protein [Nakamurella alba]MTD16530.1 hypothetical protein [Nakamurella alba]